MKQETIDNLIEEIQNNSRRNKSGRLIYWEKYIGAVCLEVQNVEGSTIFDLLIDGEKIGSKSV